MQRERTTGKAERARTHRRGDRRQSWYGTGASWHQADVGKASDVETAVTEIVDRHDGIDVLVNFAGILRGVTDTPGVLSTWVYTIVVDTSI